MNKISKDGIACITSQNGIMNYVNGLRKIR